MSRFERKTGPRRLPKPLWGRFGLALVLVLATARCGSTDESASPSSGGASGSAGAGGMDAGIDVGVGGSASGGQPATDAGVDAALLGPPYPIVLAHGFFGFEAFAGVNFATYFYQVKDDLAKNGEALVLTPAVDPFNDSHFRGAQLEKHIEAFLAQTGHAKVNIIGHSQGGLDARVVAFRRPDLVASVTTVATPHGGTPIADIVLKIDPNPNAQGFIDWLAKRVGAPLYDAIGNETSVSKPMYLFSTAGIQKFNAEIKDQPAVSYYSVTGRSDWHLGGKDCNVPGAPDFIAKYKTTIDPIDPLFSLVEELIDGGLTAPYPNDGLVRVADAKWGTFLGCVPADHLDEVGQLFGDVPGLANPWRHKPFYRDLVKYLRDQGH